MDQFDKLFSRGIPLEEASSFFINVRRPADYLVEEYSKIASARVNRTVSDIAQEMLSGKMPEGKAGHFKLAADEFTPEAIANLRAVGRGRAITALSAEAHREAGRRGERGGGVAGGLAGAAGGAAAGHKYLGGPVGTLGGAALGSMLGSKAGRELGSELDIRKNASSNTLAGIYGKDIATARKTRDALVAQHGKPEDIAAHDSFIAGAKLAMAFRKMAFGAAGQGGEGLAATQPDQSATVQPEGAPAPAPAAPSPGAPAMTQAPINYMGAEAGAERAQAANEAAYYRARMAEAVAESAGLQQSLAQSQQQAQAAQMQAQEAQQQIEMSAQESVAAGERALQNKLEVVNVTIGAQKMREQIAQLVSQDPAQINQQEQAAQQQAAEQQAMAQQGMPGAPGESPDPGSAPGSVPAENNQGGGTNANADTQGGGSTAEPAAELKTAMARHYASMTGKKKVAGLLRNIKRFPETLSGKRVRNAGAAKKSKEFQAKYQRDYFTDLYAKNPLHATGDPEGYGHLRELWSKRIIGNADKAVRKVTRIHDQEVAATRNARLGAGAAAALGAYGVTKEGSKTAGLVADVGADLLRRAPYFAAGAALGAGNSHMQARGADAARAHVNEVAKKPASFAQALELASAKADADYAAIHRDYPERSMLESGLKGGVASAAFGPSVVSSGKRISSLIKDYVTARRS